MNFIQITVYVLVGIGILAIVAALIWTKIIKPNTFAYASKGWYYQHLLFKQLKEIKNNNNFIFKGCWIHLKDPTKPYQFLPFISVFVTKQKVFFITSFLNDQKQQIVLEKNKIKIATKKRVLDLPYEIENVLKSEKQLRRFLASYEYQIIIPTLNPSTKVSFSDKPNLIFLNLKKIQAFLQKQQVIEEDFNTNPTFEEVLWKIKSHNYYQPIRIPFLNTKIKNTVWDKTFLQGKK